ncbi:relaxase/mobilization nuclease domain-containing protein [Spirosoma sp. 209]|uniref:relaxase/mobilization nuclease domain-containing protein n=1 Tax=Spirosoma sp. 209 TaxID=1955701 RepID=UPI001115BED7|nr:relaxase/mobilization nuclease domain-containing protein [Spirosoma sp. 209]
MVIRGAIRGNGRQLAQYLLSGEANERVQVMDVAGRLNATDAYVHQTLQSMSMTSELTKSQKGLYHTQINPAYSEDRKMSEKDWLKAADILGNELGLPEQRRVIVLHTKKGRTHAHVVWERYDHKTGKVIDNKFSRLAQDRARKEMERVFEQQPTPHRNQHRPELKEALTNLWNQTETGKEFVKAVHESGYLLAEGVPRHPFMVVDEHGRSFDLVRQLKGIRIKEVRQRLRNETLMPEKEAIELMRQKQEGVSDANKAEPQFDLDTAKRTTNAFRDNKQDATQEIETESRKRMNGLAESFIQSGQELTEVNHQPDSLEKKKKRVRDYFLNADELTGQAEESTAEESTAPHVEDHPVTREEISAKPQSDESQQSQQGIAEQWAVNKEEASQPLVELNRKRYQDILKGFLQAEDDLVNQDAPISDETALRQQTTARQFFENEELTTAEVADDEDELEQLMQEQRAIRERNRQKVKKRVR